MVTKNARRLLPQLATEEVVKGRKVEVPVQTEVKKRFVMDNMDMVPLSNLFPLPKNYRSDVAAALNAGSMTKKQKELFLAQLPQLCSLAKSIQAGKTTKMLHHLLSRSSR